MYEDARIISRQFRKNENENERETASFETDSQANKRWYSMGDKRGKSQYMTDPRRVGHRTIVP
jgi:hypothetical protein